MIKDEKLAELQKKFAELLKEYNATTGYQMDFPKYRELPEEVELALIILAKHGMVINLTLKSKDPVASR